MGMHALKGRVEQTILPSQVVESTRIGIKNVTTPINEYIMYVNCTYILPLCS